MPATILVVLPLLLLAMTVIHHEAQDSFAAAREQMVSQQMAARGITDPRILAAFRAVPRHEFVLPGSEREAYEDRPLGIGHGQTISQPYIVALMTLLARPAPTDRVLEIGTGSGYQAAVLSRLAGEVYSIEIIEPLASQARRVLEKLGVRNVTIRVGDGYAGWPDKGPFDAIVVTAAPDHVPPALIAQVKPGGRLVIPVGGVSDVQELQIMEKDGEGHVRARNVAPVRFVPLVRKDE